VNGVAGRIVVFESFNFVPLPHHRRQQAAHALHRRQLKLVSLKTAKRLKLGKKSFIHILILL
jgi:hypothetical protein